MDLKIGAKTLRSKDIIGFIIGFKKNRRCSHPPPVENKQSGAKRKIGLQSEYSSF
ncbi:hypothetical protein LguiB_004197 [Lonicera macranthoides]